MRLPLIIPAKMSGSKKYAKTGTYPQKSVLRRIEAFFLDNIGKVATREMLQEIAKDPETGKIPENWHQRLSDLRCLHGYTIRSWRNQGDLKIMEYLMPFKKRRAAAKQRERISKNAWEKVLERSNSTCEWNEAGDTCGLKEGDIDPVGGGTVRLQADHKRPHSINAHTDPNDPEAWRALCGRHQIVKKNFWDDKTGKLNVYGIVQAASVKEKEAVYQFLKRFFGE
jgi:hypothetical protein